MNIFEDKTPMPPKNNSPDVVRTALTMSENRANHIPADVPPSIDVQNVQRPNRGCHY